jgi:transcriptional regulator with XRE-family HTH domain
MPKKKPAPSLPELTTLPGRLVFARGMSTQKFIAEKAGMSPSQLTRYEHGEGVQGIEAATVIKLANALGVPVGWLAAQEGGPPTVPIFREGQDGRRKAKPDDPKGSK